MKIIFVIQQLLRICQSDRLCGSTDGVKSIDTSVNLFFTRSRLLSYTTHFARGYRWMLATALLVGISMGFPNKAIGQVISGATVNANSLTCGTAPLIASGGILYIGNGIDPAKLDINADLDLRCLGPLQLIIQSNGTIDFSQDAWLKLASGSSVTIILTGTPGKLSASPCNSKQEFFIGTERYGCNPGHQNITFPEVEAQGGTGIISSNSPVCSGSQIALFVSPPPTFILPCSYSWSKSGTTFIPSSSVNNPTIENATPSNSGIYTVVITGSNSAGNPVTVTRTLSVTVSPAPTTANAGPNQTDATTCGLTTVTLAANTPVVGTGAWTILTGAGGTVTDQTSPTSTFSGVAGTAYTLRWTISADCAVSTNDVNITFNANTINLNSTPGTNAQNICINTQITDITYAVGGSATGATVSVLPAGLTGVYNSGVFTISGTPTVSGIFNYTVTTTGPSTCANATVTGTITINPIPTAPTVTVLDKCNGTWELTASAYTGTLLWSNDATTTATSVNTIGTYTVTQTVSGCTSLPGSGTAATETILPTFLTDPPSKPFCVENFQKATYDPVATDINPADRPDYYTLKAHDTDLDLAPATYFWDNCTPINNLTLHWSITNSADEPIKSVSDVFLTDITGQVSDYTNAIATQTNIVFQGAVNADVTYKITYWLEDTCGNLSDPRVTTITIKPRPNIIKLN